MEEAGKEKEEKEEEKREEEGEERLSEMEGGGGEMNKCEIYCMPGNFSRGSIFTDTLFNNFCGCTRSCQCMHIQ